MYFFSDQIVVYIAAAIISEIINIFQRIVTQPQVLVLFRFLSYRLFLFSTHFHLPQNIKGQERDVHFLFLENVNVGEKESGE